MRKLILGVITLIVVLVLAGCNSKKEGPFDKLNDLENYTMVLTMEIPIFGKLETTSKVDGDVEFVKGFGEEYYLSLENDVQYKYSEDVNGTWTKQVHVEEDVDDETEELDPSEFKDDWFEIVDNKYILKSDFYDEVFGEDADDIRLFEMTIEDDVYTIDFEMNAEGMIISAQIILKDINKTVVELPVID